MVHMCTSLTPAGFWGMFNADRSRSSLCVPSSGAALLDADPSCRSTADVSTDLCGLRPTCMLLLGYTVSYTVTGWWFGTWLLFSISYMGCHPSHWLSYFSEGWNHQPGYIWFRSQIKSVVSFGYRLPWRGRRFTDWSNRWIWNDCKMIWNRTYSKCVRHPLLYVSAHMLETDVNHFLADYILSLTLKFLQFLHSNVYFGFVLKNNYCISVNPKSMG